MRKENYWDENGMRYGDAASDLAGDNLPAKEKAAWDRETLMIGLQHLAATVACLLLMAYIVGLI